VNHNRGLSQGLATLADLRKKLTKERILSAMQPTMVEARVLSYVHSTIPGGPERTFIKLCGQDQTTPQFP
jgi:hypothetical protein